jgi:uncharacterized SAM-binding protein YcdF (DUF218 family)
MYFLSKLLPIFFLPLGFSLILLVVGLARKRARLAWAGVVILFVSSNPMVGHYLIRSAEGWAVRRSITEVAAADAIVVLSAGRTLAPGSGSVSEWKDANRFSAGTELMLAGKAPLLVFTGAAIGTDPGVPSEGAVLSVQARAMGVDPGRIVVTPLVLNTADEAREVAAVLRSRQVQHARILLVTSAFHMPRAQQIFRQAGLNVDPFSVSFASSDSRSLTVFSFLPSVSALGQTQTSVRELYGRAFYWLKGAIDSQ